MNPRPSVPSQGFSGCSLCCRSTRPQRLHRHIADEPSHEDVPSGPRGLIRTVSHLADAGTWADDELRPTESLSLRQRERTRSASYWHLNLSECRIYEVTNATLDPLPLERLPKSKPITPCGIVKAPRRRAADTRATRARRASLYRYNAVGTKWIPGSRPGQGETPAGADARRVYAARGGGRQGRADLGNRQSLPRDEVLSPLGRYPLSRPQS